MSHVSESDHRRLEALIFPDCIVESHQISDSSRGLRRVQITKVWRTERLLGRGGFGEVHLQRQDSSEDVKRALKVIPTGGAKLSLTECQRELTAMIEFTKPKYRDAAVFVDFFGWFQNDDAMFLAMEYMPLGDLEQNVREVEKSLTHSGSPISEGEIQEICRQILEGLKIMHAEGFAHRDLKPQNVFVVQKHPQWWIKLGDFGLTKKRTDGTAYRTHAGTQEYMAPELFYYVHELDTETSEYTNAIDLWSLGCIIYRLATGKVPFPSMLSLRNYCIDRSTVPFQMPPKMEEAAKFVHGLLMPHPAKRPVASAALESNWLITNTKPTILVNDIEPSFATLSILPSQTNYNTTSHKGLQSYYSMPAANHPPSNSTGNGPAWEPLSLETSGSILDPAKADLQKGNKGRVSDGDTAKPNTGLVELHSSTPSRYRSISQPPQPPTTELVANSPDVTLRQKPRKQISANALHEKSISPFGPVSPLSAIDPLPLPSVLPATETFLGGPVETNPLTLRWEDSLSPPRSHSADGSPILPHSASTISAHQSRFASLSFDGENPNRMHIPPIRPPKIPIQQTNPVKMAWGTAGQTISKFFIEDHAMATSLYLTSKYIVIALDNSRIFVFNTDGKDPKTLPGHIGGVWAIAPWGDTLVSAGTDRDVRVWDMSTGKLKHILRGHISTVRCLKMSDYRTAISGSRDGTIRIWDLETGRCKTVLVGHSASVRCLEIKGDILVSGSYDKTAKVWSVSEGECLFTLHGHIGQVYAIAFDGTRIATGSLDTSIRIWDPKNGSCQAILLGHTSLVGHLQMRGNILVSGGSEGSVRVWSLETMATIHKIAAHEKSVLCLQSDDSRIISGSSDGCVRVWDIKTGQLVRELTGSADTAWLVAFEQEKFVLLASKSNEIILEVWSFLR